MFSGVDQHRNLIIDMSGGAAKLRIGSILACQIHPSAPPLGMGYNESTLFSVFGFMARYCPQCRAQAPAYALRTIYCCSSGTPKLTSYSFKPSRPPRKSPYGSVERC